MNALARFLTLAAFICSATVLQPVRLAVGQDRSVAFAEVDGLIQKNVQSKKIAGATAIVMQNGKVIYDRAIGFQDVESSKPMSSHSMFRIASMTKPITSVAIMMLVDDGKLKLDTPLKSLIPEFANMKVLPLDERDSSKATDAVGDITIHQLLSHTSGLTYSFNIPADKDNALQAAGVCDGLIESKLTLEENAKRIAKAPLIAQPGAAWNYGLSTDILGRVVEVASGMSFEKFLQTRLFDPIGMKDTHFVVPQDKLSRLAQLYRTDGKGGIEATPHGPQTVGAVSYSSTFQLPDATTYRSGGAGLVSTARDYAAFLQMLLNHGKVGDKQLLSAESIHQMTINQIGDGKISYAIHGDKFGYGFGLHTENSDRNGSSIGTYSWAGIFYSYFWVDPQKNLVAVLMPQLFPAGEVNLWAEFQQAVNRSVEKPTLVKTDAAAEPGGAFTPLFNGTDLTGWDCDKRFWRVEDGIVIGQTTPENPAPHNTFLIYRGREYGDFELTFEYQVEGFNSGIQYRSSERPDYVIDGYQADFEARWHKADNGPIDKFSGMFFEENGRMFMGQRGQAVLVRENKADPKKPLIQQLGSLGDPTEMEQAIKRDGWNRYRVIAKGYHFAHIINDRVMSMAIDEDEAHRKASGLLAFQLHSGTPMTIRVRNLEIRE
jgi:CubicO group peptidase (beta-lactamase class C family)